MNVTLDDILTPAQVRQAQKLSPDVKAIQEEVIAPNLENIDRKLGQKNDARYLAYLVLYMLNRPKQ